MLNLFHVIFIEWVVMVEAIVRVQDLTKYFPIKLGFLKTLMTKSIPVVRAVDNVSFEIGKGEVFGLVGESGSGKTTVGRVILRLIEPTAGKIFFDGKDITSLPPADMQKLRSEMQIVFQDPYESLNPRASVFNAVAEPLHIQHSGLDADKVTNAVEESLREMGLIPPEQFLFRFPHELSGGQRQRVAVARAFVTEPKFIVADEPVSMLDASVRTEVSELMLRLVNEAHLSLLYITHDIALARYMCNRVAIMYLGEIVETGPVDEIIMNPYHPYTAALMRAVPVPNPKARRIKVVISGEIPSPVNPPPGCRFHTRCRIGKEICREEKPQLIEVEKDRYLACHFPLGR